MSKDKILELLSRHPNDSRVNVAYISKPDGGKRRIVAPDKDKRAWLGETNRLLNGLFADWPVFMHGGIVGRSFVSHAATHVNGRDLVTIDIKKCFDSIKFDFVVETIKSKLELPEGSVEDLARKLCHEGKLAQGFATSNFLCNLCLLKPLTEVNAACENEGLAFSCYVDDLAISGNINDGRGAAKIIDGVLGVLKKSKLRLNKNKISFATASREQVVCGIKVNERLTITKEYRKKIFRHVAKGGVDESKIDGTIAHLKNVDPKLAKDLMAYRVCQEFANG